MKLDDNNKKVSNEFFDFHEKVNKILEEQEEIFSIHMAAIKVTKLIKLKTINHNFNNKLSKKYVFFK